MEGHGIYIGDINDPNHFLVRNRLPLGAYYSHDKFIESKRKQLKTMEAFDLGDRNMNGELTTCAEGTHINSRDNVHKIKPMSYTQRRKIKYV